MNRRNRHKTDVELFGMLNAKGFALGTDFIVGHPGETDALWEEGMRNIQELHLTHVHPFTYSKRDGTPSATMKDQINGAVSQKRMVELNAHIAKNNRAFRQNVNVPLEVLIESGSAGVYSGLDQFFNKIIVKSDEDLSGNWITVEKYEVNDEHNVAQF
jgi:tRNA A37 methylthiotransferase MiaB